MGLYEKLTVAADGSILYVSNHFNDTELVLTETELQELLNKIELLTSNMTYAARPNTADYFTYKVTVETTSGSKIIKWVDSWASESALPFELEDLKDQMLSIIERLHQEP